MTAGRNRRGAWPRDVAPDDPAASGAPGDWSNVIVVSGAVPWDGSRMLDQHLATGLSRYGPVLYVEPPVPWRPRRPPDSERRPKRERSCETDLRIVQPGLALVTPHTLPGHERPGMKRVSVAIVRRTMARAVKDLDARTVRAVILTSPEPYFGACREQRKVYYATDDYAAGAALMGLSAKRLQRDMRRRPAEADLVVAASPALAESLRAQGYETLMLPNGCDPSAFDGTELTASAADAPSGHPVAGFMGHLSDRIDVRYLDAIARRGHTLLLVGPGPRSGLGDELSALVRRPNVHWVGPRTFEELPSYLTVVDVGLVPYTDTPFNHASFPLKALEYLAAGRPVLSTDIEAIRWLRQGHTIGPDDGAPLAITDDDIVVAGDPDRFADAAERLMALERDAEAVARRQAFARTHSWERRFSVLAEALGLADAGSLTSGP